MKWFRGVIAAAVLMMVAVPAAGQDPLSPPDVNSVKFVSGSGYSGGTPVQVGPYWAQWEPWALTDDQIFGSPEVKVYCVDPLHTVYSGLTYDAWFTPLDGDLGDLASFTRAGVQWNGATALLKYQTAAYLTSYFTTANRDYWADIHASIWDVMTGDVAEPGWAWWSGVSPYNWAAWAGTTSWDPMSADLGGWYVITDAESFDPSVKAGYMPGMGAQEFLVQNVNVVPEPATIILMGTGLVAVLGMTVIMRRSVG